MNWTCLVYGGPMLGVTIWWMVDARKWFKGPKVNVEHSMLERDNRAMESTATEEKSSPELEECESVSK